MSDQTPPGSTLRTLVLAAMIFALTAATFEVESLAAFVYFPRYIFAVLLLVVTFHQGEGVRRSLDECPPPARLLIKSAQVLVVVAAVSTVWSVDRTETVLQTIVFAVLVANMQTHMTRRWHHPGTILHDMRTIYWVIASTVVASLALGTQVGGRLSGIYDNPNTLSLMAAMTVAIGTGLLAHRGSWLVLFVTTLSAVALLMTESRTAFAGLVLALAWVGLRRRAFPPWAVMSALFVAALSTAVLLVYGRIPLPSVVTRFQGGQPEGVLSYRDIAWNHAVDLWQQQPWTGYGFRAGEVVFQQNRHLTAFSSDGAHNSYLQTLLEVGVIGFIPFAVMILALVRAVWTVSFSGIGAGLVALVIVGLAMGTAESALFGVGQAMSWTFWLGAAAACAVAPAQASSESPLPVRTKRILVKPYRGR
ncbi:O-antigen ligase family protein [Georgenia sp. MJ206]|uniref:O-antigen ligase family protein n=1 Tax=Georgenia wangjunii TaxID=3117730 RepID=UPI002F260900